MANFYVSHHKYPSNPQLFTITLNKVASRGGEINPNFSPSFSSAEEYWKIFIYTTGLDSDGNSVGPIVADVRGSEETVQELIETKIAELSSLIDWSQQGTFTAEEDSNAPYVIEQYPDAGQANISINSPIVIRVKEPLPGIGINPASVVMVINGIQITPSMSGNKYDMTFSFSPRPIYD